MRAGWSFSSFLVFSFLRQHATGSVQNQGGIFAWHEFVTKGFEADNCDLSSWWKGVKGLRGSGVKGFGGWWRVAGSGWKEKFWMFDFGFWMGFPAKTPRREELFFNRRGAEGAEDGPVGAGPYRRFEIGGVGGQ